MKKEKIAFALAVLLALGLAACGQSAAPASSAASSGAAASPAASPLAEQPTPEEVVEHIQTSKPNWVGRTITCAFSPDEGSCVTTIALSNGRRMLDQALTNDSKMASWNSTMTSYANFNAEIQSYLLSGGYEGVSCTVILCDEDDPADVLAEIDADNNVTVTQ